MNKRLVTIASLTAIMATATAARSADETAAFAGRWRVTGVAVSDDGVQALGDNDPSLMDKRLTFSRARLAWDRPTATRDGCIDPQIRRLGTPAPAALRPQLRKLGMPRPTSFAIRCRSGSWGPGGGTATIFRGDGDALAMPWYDGGLLRLARQ